MQSEDKKTGQTAGPGLAESAIYLYGLPSGTTVRLVSLSENEMYQLAAPDGQKWAMRLARPRYQSRQSLASELAWMAALQNESLVIAPRPQAGRDGAMVQRIFDPSTGAERDAVLFSWEEGTPPMIEMDLRACFRGLGAIIAKMHAHSRRWVPPSDFVRFRWDVDSALGETGQWGRWQDGLGMDAARISLFSRVVQRIRERLEVFGDGAGRFGLVHGDLRLANLLLHEEQIKVLDFDDCGFNWYLADVANCVSFYEHLPQVPQLIACLLEGYRTVGEVSREEEDEIPTFLMLRRLLLVAWIGSHTETPIAQSLGVPFTDQTVELADGYLKRFG